MKRKQVAALCIAAAMAVSGNGFSVAAKENVRAVQRAASDGLASPILITEAVPNTKNLSGSDAWEYYEITNVSTQDVNLDDYDIVYVNGNTRTIWKAEGVNVLPAGQTMLVWVKNDGNTAKTKADFCANYGLPEESLVAEVTCGGMVNSGTRSFDIVTKTGRVLTTVTYNSKDSAGGTLDEDEAIMFQYTGRDVVPVYDQTVTPLVIPENNIAGSYQSPVKIDAPYVQTAGPSKINAEEALQLKVSDTNLKLGEIVAGTINIEGVGTYPLTYDADGNLGGEIPGNAVKGKDSFNYTVSVTDGVNTAVSEPKEVRVLASTVDTAKAPALTITEILPDSSNINGADAYEFVEMYNNSDKTINLKDYKLYYHYPDSGSDVIWWETKEDKLLGAGETLVFWVKNGANDSLTRDDFNKKFGTSLGAEQLIEISCGGMANSGARGLRIASNVKDDIDFVTYNMNGADDTYADKSITYQNQHVNGSFQSVMTSNSAKPTPGSVTAGEKPDYEAKLTVPANAPVLTDKTAGSFDNTTESLRFAVTAASEETTVKTVTLYLKYNGKDAFESYNLLRSNGDEFEKTLENIDILNKESFTYYFEVSDGFQTVRSEEKTIQNTSTDRNVKFNLQENETLAGSRQVIASGKTLLLDGNDVTADAEASLNGSGKIVFDASQTDVFFKNAVAVGSQVVGIFNEGTYDQWRTYVYDIDAAMFDAKSRKITVEFHAGNKANPLEHNIENNDDFVLKNVRMIMPDGETLYPSSYEAKKGLGVVEHDNLDQVQKQNVPVESQEKEIQMGDGTSKYEILYATFEVPEKEFNAVRYLWDTKKTGDGMHQISNGTDSVNVNVDNTAPEIRTNIEEGKEYHGGTITADTVDAGGEVRTSVLLDGKLITLPYDFRALEMTPGEHRLSITASDRMGNTATKEVTFTTPRESADIDENVQPENGAVTDGSPTLSVKPTDPTDDTMRVTFKRGERYLLTDPNISRTTGVSDTAGKDSQVFSNESGNGFPYEVFDITVDDTVDENAVIQAVWSGTSNSQKTFLYAYNTVSGKWDKVEAVQTEDKDKMTLRGEVALAEHLAGGKVKMMVQNGEGYTPAQYGDTGVLGNPDDTARSDYDFTFAVETDTQYYNEDYDGNPNQDVDGNYQYQLDIHNWILANRERMNIQYLFHDGDIIDDEPNEPEWQQADAAYRILDNAGFPYGILAGNHDVGHLKGDYSHFSRYFGENRYNSNPWYGGSYQDNRCHYDLVSVDGIDFIMMYAGWGINDEEINWMNQVLAQYPERKAILNFHEYLLASGGMGEEPQRVYNEVVSKNENVCMVLSGHYHNAYNRVDTFTNADGSTRKVYSLLFDYQGLPEGGLGYMRLMHFDTKNGRVIVRTYSPSLNDYDADVSEVPNEGNSYVAPNANLNGQERFEIPFSELGIEKKVKTLTTENLDVNVYGSEVIGQVENVASGTQADYVWKNAPEGINGWYAEVTDANGGLSRTNVRYLNVVGDHTVPTITLPEEKDVFIGDRFDAMEGVTAADDRDGDLTAYVTVSGTVDTGKAGSYELIYRVSDKAGNLAEVKRIVTVKEKSGGTVTKPGSSQGNSQGTPTQKPGSSGVSKKDSAVAKTVVKTGDMTSVNTSIGAGILAMAAAVAAFMKRRRR